MPKPEAQMEEPLVTPAARNREMEPIERLKDCEWEIKHRSEGVSFFRPSTQVFMVVEVPGTPITYKVRESDRAGGPYQDVAGGRAQVDSARGAKLVRLVDTDGYFEIVIWDSKRPSPKGEGFDVRLKSPKGRAGDAGLN